MAASGGINQNGFKHAITVQGRVLGALVLREMRARYGRSQIGYLWALLEPLGYVVALTIVFSYAERPAPYGNSLPLYFALGVIPFKLFMGLANQLTSAMMSNQALLTYPIVKEFDTVVARFLLEAITSIAVLVICLTGIWLIDDVPGPSQPLRMMEGLALVMLFGFGVGLTNACIIRHFASWQNVFRIITAPMVFISGIFYSFSSLPSEARAVLSWNPLIHGIEIVRDGYYSNYRAEAVDANYLLSVGFTLLVIGMFMERFYPRR